MASINCFIAYLSLIAFSFNGIVSSADFYHTVTVSTSHNTNVSTTEENRIANGDVVADGEAPALVFLNIRFKSGRETSCTGSLLSHEYIVTAAHCVTEKNSKESDYDQIFATIDSRFYDNRDGKGQIIPVRKVILHEDFDLRTAVYDVAIIKIIKYLNNPASHSYMQLSSRDESHLVDTEKVTIYGWGLTGLEAHGSEELLRGDGLKIIDVTACKKALNSWWNYLTFWTDNYWVYDYNLCVQGMKRKRGKKKQQICKGDSGGPLIRDGKMIGIASWGDGFCDGNSLEVAVKVSAVWNFINKEAELGLEGSGDSD